jgi:hypothetical protein
MLDAKLDDRIGGYVSCHKGYDKEQNDGDV